MNKKLIINCTVLVFITLILMSWYYYINLIPTEYDRAIYSVVIHNNTNIIFDDVNILYGNSIDDINTVFHFEQLQGLEAGRYRKVNIPTKEPSKKAKLPYNVYVSVKFNGCNYNLPVGHFGIETGGLAVVELELKDNTPILKRIYQHESKYKKIMRRHYRNQFELSW